MNLKTKFEKNLISKASKLNKTIILPEAGYSSRIYKAGITAAKKNIANIIFLVKNDDDLNKFGFTGFNNVSVINIYKNNLLPKLAETLVLKRKHKNLTLNQAKELLKNEIYFATTMVEMGYADGMVCGADNTTTNTIKPAFQIIKGKVSGQLISSFFILISNNKKYGDNGVFVLSDCAIIEKPSAEDIKQIVFDTVKSARLFTNINPKVALLSYSTLKSDEGIEPQKMRDAKALITKCNPDFIVDGEFQLDAAIVPKIALKKASQSDIKGDANILIFPDLSSGNIGYKMMQRFGGFMAVGPICQGLKKPVNDVSRGACVKEIVLTIAVTCLQAQDN